MSFEIALSPLQQRAIALTLAGLLIVALVATIVGAISGLIAHHSRMATLERERATYESLLSELPQRSQDLAAIKAAGTEQAFFSGMPVQAAASAIQADVARAVKSAGGSLSQSDVRAISDTGSPLVGVSDHVMLTCDIATLTRILHVIAESKPLLFVERLSIDDGGTAASTLGPHRLTIDLVLRGYVLPS